MGEHKDRRHSIKAGFRSAGIWYFIAASNIVGLIKGTSKSKGFSKLTG